MKHKEWFANKNDLVGGWIVANVDESLGDIDMRTAGVRVIAECITEEDARRIAELLNYSEDPDNAAAALIYGLAGNHTDLWLGSASFHAFGAALALLLTQVMDHLAKFCEAEREVIAAKIKDAERGEGPA